VIPTFDDRGIADAFYTVLSTGIVLLAGLAIASVVLNAAAHQGQAVADRLDAPGAGYQKGLYAFYYTADKSADFSSADPCRIPPGGYVTLRTEPGIALSKSGLPKAPRHTEVWLSGPGMFSSHGPVTTGSCWSAPTVHGSGSMAR
jgi:hypothetical protein